MILCLPDNAGRKYCLNKSTLHPLLGDMPVLSVHFQQNFKANFRRFSVALMSVWLGASLVAHAEEAPPLPASAENIATSPQLSTAASILEEETVSLQEVLSDLMAAQKRAFLQELELARLKARLKAPSSESVPSPWVPVNVTEKMESSNADQPAVSRPEPLKTAISAYYQYHYHVKPGDKLSLRLVGAEPDPHAPPDAFEAQFQSSADILVLPDGMIALPLLGLVPVAGQTLEQINKTLNTRLKSYYRFAVLSVGLAQAAPDSVLLLGRVQTQGYVHTAAGSTVARLLQTVGGIAPNADLSHVFVRKQSDGDIYLADLDALLATGDTRRDVVLENGDVVLVPEGSSNTAFEQYLNTTWLPDSFTVRVLGAANRVDAFHVKPGDTVSTLLAKAGGPKPYAQANNLLLIRHDKMSETLRTLRFQQTALFDPSLRLQTDIPLHPNDLLLIEDTVPR